MKLQTSCSDLGHVAVSSTGLRDIVDILEEFVKAGHLGTHLFHGVGHTENWQGKTQRQHEHLTIVRNVNSNVTVEQRVD